MCLCTAPTRSKTHKATFEYNAALHGFLLLRIGQEVWSVLLFSMTDMGSVIELLLLLNLLW